jgi:hypothetical protein
MRKVQFIPIRGIFGLVMIRVADLQRIVPVVLLGAFELHVTSWFPEWEWCWWLRTPESSHAICGVSTK